ncbi:MAG: hypothetical protein ACXABG_07315 [Promethearchaeota archaeon]|jgi:hypothetical protein
MDNKLYVCRSCQYVFAKELSELIESKVQVYCEICGTPFSLSGVSFKEVPVRKAKVLTQKPPTYGAVDKKESSLEKAIKTFNKFDYIPIVIYPIITLLLSFFNILTPGGISPIVSSYLILFSCIFIIIYDSRVISPKIKSNSYDEIALDAICYGILGCVIAGTGVFILIKGILIFVHTAKNSNKGDHKKYQFGLKLKNSLNNFSATAGIVILLFVLNGIYFSGIEISIITIVTSFFSNFTLMIILISFILMSCIVMIIDFKLMDKIHNKKEFFGIDIVRTFILGVLGTIFLATGIFILLKSILLLALYIGKPIDLHGNLMIDTPEIKSVPTQKELTEEPKIEKIEKEQITLEQPEPLATEQKPQVVEAEDKPQEEKIEETVTGKGEHEEDTGEIVSDKEEHDDDDELVEEVVPQEVIAKKEEDIKLRLHESLLPVKNEKDRKIVKEYFSKIFNIISKDLRKQISELDIPKKERKSILKELAFLAEEEQLYYIEELRNLYQEIPKKLFERIRNLPNFKPKYYDKIVEDLKYMDKKEQIEYMEFLEKHA